MEVSKARHELEELAEAKQRREEARSRKAAAVAAADQEAQRLNALKEQGRFHASLTGIPPVWRAKVGRALEQYVTSERFPPGLSQAEAVALVRDKVDRVLRSYRKNLADAKKAKEDRRRIEGLVKFGRSRAVTNALLWDRASRDHARSTVEEALAAEVEANWTEEEVAGLVDELMSEWEEDEQEF